MLTIKNLHVEAEKDSPILNGLSLKVNPGEVHAIMGPNGSGKSTLANVIAGKEDYQVTQGSLMFQGKDLNDMSPNERSLAGLFLAFQYPVSIPGVTNIGFLQSIVNQHAKAKGEPEMDALDFLNEVKKYVKQVGLDESFLYRGLNDDFSGGEKKRNEILQMLMLKPSLVILDEIDSGLDIDALQSVAEGVNQLRSEERSFVIVTHYQRLLEHIKPDYVHVMHQGKLIRSGDAALALELEERGYGWLSEDEKG
ncbi:MAG TPA: Fe-S cluster assembly ATPase SufC [Gammaproteobacteria bacterium]|nr:Fe-S cluster assembly ATPase SufC [Gammaproteobacteria bacterium]